MADNRIPRASSEPRSPCVVPVVMATPASGASTSTPAARNLSSALCVAVTISCDSHSWVAIATTARSSPVSSTGGSS
ncbi:Uncharacterised protein [Mycobacteroides abscessus subsp. abscessus]|nr:Uncharacterised protein [Mycobacteroides abscessus subsp. abscessus]